MVSFTSKVPDAVPVGAFWEMKIGHLELFKPFVLGVVPAGTFWELKI